MSKDVPQIVKEKKALLENIKKGDILNIRIFGTHVRREVLRVNRDRKGNISSIITIYGYTPGGDIIKHKMDKLDIINDIFLPDRPYQWYYDKYYFYPVYMKMDFPYDDVFTPDKDKDVIYTKEGIKRRFGYEIIEED